MQTPKAKEDGNQADMVNITPVTTYDQNEVQSATVDNGYLRAPRLSKFFRSVLFQMIMFGALSFVGPAMQDAITNLGGGGLSSPYLANLANSLNYAAGCVITLFGGPLINKLGIKWSCLIAAITMPLAGSAYYVNAKYSVNWYLLAANIVNGFTGGFLYVAETTAMLSYPQQNDRGFYLGIWSAMRNSGSVVGGAINFSTNNTDSSAGGISWSTYLIFIGFECTGILWAFLLSSTKKVRRRDASRVPMSEKLSWKAEFQALWKHIQVRKTWLVFIPAFYSFFYGGTMGTYLSIHFSVRARALSSLIVPTLTIPLVILYGKFMDSRRWSQARKAWIGFALWAIPQAACYIWIGVEYGKLGTHSTALDYNVDTKKWAEVYLPYLIIFVTGYWTQLSLYWILGTFSTDVASSSRTGGLFRAFETAGQAVSYAINSNEASDPRIPIYVNSGILVLTMVCMVFLIRLIPETPSSVDPVIGDDDIINGVPKAKVAANDAI